MQHHLNKTLKEKCKDVMDNSIKNIKPCLYEVLLFEVISNNIKNNKLTIEKFLRSKMSLTAHFGKHSKHYWVLRGWTNDEAYIKSKENTKKKISSVYSQNFWLNKINPVSGNHYTIEEADFERNSRRPIRKEYWIKKGYTEEKAIDMALKIKDQNNKKGALTSSKSNLHKITSTRCIEYYIARGYTEEEAKLLRSNSQKYFSKKICIEKYGKVKGLQIWKDRQDRWQKTLNDKPDDEKSRINRSKLTKGITVSKNEKILFEEIKKISPNVIHQLSIFNEGKKQYIYDIAVNKKIIEYHGDFWHANPDLYSKDFVNPRTKIKAQDKWIADENKIQFALSKGYQVLVVWENDFKKNKEEVINKCIQFLTQ